MAKGYMIMDNNGDIIDITTNIEDVLYAIKCDLFYCECDIEDKKENNIFEGCLVVDDNYSDVIGVVHNGEVV